MCTYFKLAIQNFSKKLGSCRRDWVQCFIHLCRSKASLSLFCNLIAWVRKTSLILLPSYCIHSVYCSSKGFFCQLEIEYLDSVALGGTFNLSAIQPFQGKEYQSWLSMLLFRKEYSIFRPCRLSTEGVFSLGQVYFSSERNIQFFSHSDFPGRNIESWPSIVYFSSESNI